MGLWFTSKKGIEAHEAQGYWEAFVKGLNLGPKTTAWLIIFGRSIISTLATGGTAAGLLVYGPGAPGLSGAHMHLLIWPTVLSFGLFVFHNYQQSPMPRDAWDEVQRAAFRAIQAREQAAIDAANKPVPAPVPPPPPPGAAAGK